MRRVLLALWVSLSIAAAVPVLAAPGIRVQTTRAGAGGLPVPVLPIVTRRGEVQPPFAVPGQYLIVAGEGFAANAPVTVTLTLNDGATNIALDPADPLTFAPLTVPLVADANGAVPLSAFAVPPAAQLAGRGATLVLATGPGAVAGTPVVFDVPLPNETAGDALVVGFGLAFYAAAALVVLLLVRRLPRYPVAVPQKATSETDAI